MKHIYTTLFKILVITFATSINVQAKDKDIAGLFENNHITGTLIISSLDGKTEYVYNRQRAVQPMLPASTFKILNTLIALEENAITHEKEIIPWDGTDKGWSKWNQDQTLESAFPLSCVWFYQELAKRVKNNSYLEHMQNIHYGNRKTGRDLTTFWLDGDLRISAIEQIDFLKRLYLEDLPFRKKHMALTKKLMIIEQTPEYILRAKTGWAARIPKQHGWYVGWVEKADDIWFFATNIAIDSREDIVHRKALTLAALQQKNILPASEK